MEGVCGLIKGRVSVVTPVYNGEGHVGRLLESVLAQTWDEIEMPKRIWRNFAPVVSAIGL